MRKDIFRSFAGGIISYILIFGFFAFLNKTFESAGEAEAILGSLCIVFLVGFLIGRKSLVHGW
ncbi:MAG: hypothetical protein QME64_02585, partial [bacterium]|nr:hypothetical protein [bacterium]